MLSEKLIKEGYLTREEYSQLLETYTMEDMERLRVEADRLRKIYYDNKVYVRGLIEFTNYCKNDCHYCGIRCGNKNVSRYRLTKEEILLCCEEGYRLGFRTFVLQGGEDPYFTDEKLVDIVEEIKEKYNDCALTLSIGERSEESYIKLKNAGANRYLLRHETADEKHYKRLHPEKMELKNRMKCLKQLKDLGFQVGAGFMVGSPYQTNECIAKDLEFLKELQPHMVGLGPFLPHCDTIFADCPKGNVDKTILLLSIVRILLPKVLLPATTALGTADDEGREKGILAGANVVMPNLSPLEVRKKYLLYNDKISTGDEAAESIASLTKRISNIGYRLVTERGDAFGMETKL